MLIALFSSNAMQTAGYLRWRIHGWLADTDLIQASPSEWSGIPTYNFFEEGTVPA